MKTLLATISFLLLLIFFSCKNSNLTSTADRKTKMLIAHSWEIEHIYFDRAGDITEYERGSINNTGANYDTVRFTFYKDGTGKNVDGNGDVHNISWKFTTPDHDNMQLIIYQNPVYTTTWSMIDISKKAIFQTNANDGILETGKLIPTK